MDVVRIALGEDAVAQVPAPRCTAAPDAAAFAQLYRDRYEPMVRLAYLLVGHGAVAEELVQDAFVAMHRQWSHVEHPAAYLRTAVVNGCRSWGRRRTRERERLRLLRALPDETGLAADELWDVLLALPARQRAAIVLRFYEDLPDGEIAAALGCRPATVRSLVFRGLRRLREETGS